MIHKSPTYASPPSKLTKLLWNEKKIPPYKTFPTLSLTENSICRGEFPEMGYNILYLRILQ